MSAGALATNSDTAARTSGHILIRPIMSSDNDGQRLHKSITPSPFTTPSLVPLRSEYLTSFILISSSASHCGRCRRSPLRAHQLLDRRDSRAPGSVEQVAVGPMFDGVAPRVAPIVENLAAQDMAADAPFMLPSLLAKPVVPAHQVVEIRDFERGMIELRLSSADQEQGVMVARNCATIAAQKCAQRFSAAQIYLVRRDETETRFVPGLRLAEVFYVEHAVAEPLHVRWRMRQTLQGVLARRFVRIVGQHRAPNLDSISGRATGDDFDPEAVRVIQFDHRATAGSIKLANRGILRLRERFQIRNRSRLERHTHEPGVAAMGHVQKLIRIEAAHVERFCAALRARHPEVSQKTFHRVQVGRAESHEGNVLNLDSHMSSFSFTAKIDATAAAPIRAAEVG